MSNNYLSVEQVLAKDFFKKLKDKEAQLAELLTTMRLEPLEYNYQLGRITAIRDITAEFETTIKELFPR